MESDGTGTGKLVPFEDWGKDPTFSVRHSKLSFVTFEIINSYLVFLIISEFQENVCRNNSQ
jgi:hypothetical protein